MNFGDKIKFFNYRPLVSVCLFLIAGIIFAVGIFINNLTMFILGIVSSICLIVSLVVKSIVAKDKKLIKILAIIIAFFIGFGVTGISLSVQNRTNVVKGEYYVSGSVSNYTFTSSSGLKVVTIDDVKITNVKTLKQQSLTCKVRLYLNSGDGRTEEFKLGEEVEGVFSLKKSDFMVKGKLNFYMINKGIKVLGFGSEDDIVSKNEINPSLFDKIKVKVKSTLDTYMSKEYSELGYTMLFGDKTNLDVNIANNYSESGIGHLLAVSGLHVGFVVTLLSLLLSLFKANNKVRFFVITIVVFLYAFLCGFSISVTRAFIMTTILLFSKLRNKKYDSLSSLSFAAIILLLCNPLFLFDIGFILSFSAVAGIIIFARTFTNFFNKFLNDKLSSVIAVSLSATIGTMPAMMLSFNNLSIFSIITNVIVIPIASVAYMLMFAFVFVAMILPPLGVFMYMFEFLMRIVSGISQITGSINLVNTMQIFVILFSIGLISTAIIISDYCIVKKKSRVIMASCLSLFTLVSMIMMFIC